MQNTAHLIKRIYKDFIRAYLPIIKFAAIFMTIAALLTAAVAQMLEPILNIVLQPGSEEYVLPVALALGTIFALRGVVTYIHTILMNKASQSIIADIQMRLFGHFMTLELDFFHRHPSGQLISRIINDVTIMRMAITDTLTGAIKSTLTLIFLVIVMFHQDWKLACFAIFVFPFAAAFVAKLGRRLRKVANSAQEELGDLSARLAETFQGMRQVKIYNAQSYEIEKTNQVIIRVRDLLRKGLRIGTLSTPVNETLAGVTIFGIIYYGGSQVNAGEMTAGQIVSFIAAFMLAYEPMKKLARLNNNLQTGLGAAERVFAMLDIAPQVKDYPHARQIDFNQPEIKLENVCFSYPETTSSPAPPSLDTQRNIDAPIRALENVTITLSPGTVTALVGPSGGGKSTILNLIPRFYDLDDGRITIDGTDIQEISLHSLRGNIALVSQDITIFDDTIEANIAYGSPEASEDDILRAAHLAAAHDFISTMADGYKTQLGENGTKLSGGQRQRISIARAILSQAPILLLDEATSALDTESERAIQQSLKDLQKGRTTLVIAHRLSTIQDADHIIVLDNGMVAEQGTHQSLLKQQGLYSRMHQGDHHQEASLPGSGRTIEQKV